MSVGASEQVGLAFAGAPDTTVSLDDSDGCIFIRQQSPNGPLHEHVIVLAAASVPEFVRCLRLLQKRWRIQQKAVERELTG